MWLSKLLWAILGPSWLFGAFLGCSGVSWAFLSNFEPCWAFLGSSGLFQAILGCSELFWTILGCFFSAFWAVSHCKWLGAPWKHPRPRQAGVSGVWGAPETSENPDRRAYQASSVFQKRPKPSQACLSGV